MPSVLRFIIRGLEIQEIYTRATNVAVQAHSVVAVITGKDNVNVRAKSCTKKSPVGPWGLPSG